ncbi:hypothetical protein FQA47_021816 [Oryzias melastigma]|uniref:Uncharacterized protein n=1 Tax=Oryzias melastigma TaxID=30732 RepID=A0A834FRA8_ORYME|nr:hypothetical protein FQA47_021816 [Oryzias melastigma]
MCTRGRIMSTWSMEKVTWSCPVESITASVTAVRAVESSGCTLTSGKQLSGVCQNHGRSWRWRAVSDPAAVAPQRLRATAAGSDPLNRLGFRTFSRFLFDALHEEPSVVKRSSPAAPGLVRCDITDSLAAAAEPSRQEASVRRRAHLRVFTAHPRAVRAHQRAVRAHPRAVRVHLRVFTAHPRAVRAHPRAVRAHPRAVTAHPGPSGRTRGPSGRTRGPSGRTRGPSGRTRGSLGRTRGPLPLT